MKRVVVTGMAGITSLGSDWPTIAAAFKAGKSGIRRMDEWDRFSELNTRLGGPVDDFVQPKHWTRKQTRSMGRVSKLAVYAAERALEQVQARPSLLAVPLRELWNPDTCPAHLLPWLAWTLSLDSWQPYWPEAVKRQRIRAAVEIQRRKAPPKACATSCVRSAPASPCANGGNWSPRAPRIRLKWSSPFGAGVPNTAAYQQDVIAEIERTKPVRAHFTLTLGLAATGALASPAPARPVIYRRIQCTEAP